MVDVNKVNQINAQYDNKTVKIADNKGQVHEVKLSIFQDGMAVTSDTKDIASYFNFNKNGKLEADEVAVLKKVISDYAGADKKLEDKEILQIFGMTSESPNAAKMLQQFKNMVERQAAGTLSNTVTNEDGSKRTESFNADGSGTVVEVSAGENPKRTTSYYGKGNVLLKKEQVDASGTTTCEYTNNEEGQPVSAKSSFVDKDGNTVSTTEIKYTYENGKKVASEAKITDSKGEITTKEEKYTYNEQGLLVKTEGVKTKPAKLKLPNGQTGNSVEEYTEEREYHPNGELAKKVKTTGKLNLAGSVSTSYYNENGQLTRQEMQKNQLRIGKDKNGGMTLRQETTTQSVDFEYHSNGKKSKTVIKNVDSAGYPSETVQQFAEDGTTITSKEKTYYKCGAKVDEKYEGININNRVGLPSEKIEYEKDGTTIKQKTVNHFDNDGILVSRDVYDKDGNKIKSYDFSEVDGVFEVSNQVSRGDCYLLAGINSLALTEDGQKLLKQNIQVKTDDKGQKEYTVTLPGAANVRENLKKIGVPEDKIAIQESYTVTEEELKEAAKKAGRVYSAGDKDVLLLEIVYEKYRNGVAETLKSNSDNKDIKNVFGMSLNLDSKHAKDGDYLSGGLAYEAIYVLTGNAPAVYINPKAKECPVCYIDDNLQLHLTDPNGNIVANYDIDSDGPTNAEINSLLEQLEKDCASDGKIDNFAATAGFKISSQEINGQVFEGRGHAFSITKVDKDYVYLANPWSPDTEIKMSREDFAKAATKMSITPINEEGKKDVTKIVDKPIDGRDSGDNNVKHKSNYTVPKGKTYNGMIREALISQGIPATPENIQKAKEQFEAENPRAVHRMRKKGRNGRRRTVLYLYANDKVYIPQFKIS